MRTSTPVLVALVCALAPAAPAQDVGDAATASQPSARLQALARDLTDDKRRSAAMHDLMQARGEGARAVWQAFRAAAEQKSPDAEAFARSLAELGTSTTSILESLVAQLGDHDEPLRSHLLRAVSNAALFSTAEQRDQIRVAIRTWAERGMLYSPSADEPTFAWYEYVRLVRRMALAEGGASADAITAAMARLRQNRGTMPLLGQQPARQGKHPHCAIESWGAHGQREVLEGIAELALRCDDVSAAVLDELHSYLSYSPPRSPRLRTEHCAGIGENAPNALPGRSWPTHWLYDEWHFACAQAVLQRSREREARTLALRHLLYASHATMRLRAIEQVRNWPAPRQEFGEDLKQCLRAKDRTIVRAALVTIAQDADWARAARDELQALQNGSDRELQLLAGRALRVGK